MAVSLPVSRLVVLALVSVALPSCADMRANTDSEVVNSMRFDTVPCATLMKERDELVRTYGSPASLPPDKQPGIRPILKQQPMGMFPVPEYRSKKTVEQRRAWGRIEAMNRSIERRQCGKPQPKNKNNIIP
jgi:hypothetical protein